MSGKLLTISVFDCTSLSIINKMNKIDINITNQNYLKLMLKYKVMISICQIHWNENEINYVN